MSKLVLYPTRPRVGQSYKGVKRVVVPNQSLSLEDILKRFVRREALPVMKEGIYEDRFEDLEKMSKKDILEQQEYAASLQRGIKKGQERLVKERKDREEKEAAERAKPLLYYDDRDRAKGSSAPPSPVPPDSK